MGFEEASAIQAKAIPVVMSGKDMIGQAQIMSNEANGKAFVIHEAELMNENAQNALLKLLEEPPKFVRFFLCAEKPLQLLETVQLRPIQ